MTTANKITLARLALIPIFMAVLLLAETPFAWAVALALYLIAAATDGLDGFIARKYNQITTMGKFLDPLADKILVLAALCAFLQMGLTSAWVVFIIVTRELVITSFRIVSINKGVVIAADRAGKLKTLSQNVAVVVVMLEYILAQRVFVGGILLWISVALTVYSGVSYIVKNFHVLDFKGE